MPHVGVTRQEVSASTPCMKGKEGGLRETVSETMAKVGGKGESFRKDTVYGLAKGMSQQVHQMRPR